MGSSDLSLGIYMMSCNQKKSFLYTMPIILVVLICILEADCCQRSNGYGRRKREAAMPVKIHVEELEVVAFDVCNSDSIEGLSWAEVEVCEGKFCDLLPIGCPSKQDFNDFDVNKDGILTFAEWKDNVQLQ